VVLIEHRHYPAGNFSSMQWYSHSRPDDDIVYERVWNRVVEGFVDSGDVDDHPGNSRHSIYESRRAVF